MRLDEKELEGIFKAHNTVVPLADIYLYGSRTDDDKRGGDIDLLVVLPDNLVVDLFRLKLDFSLALEQELGERRIDITLVYACTLKTDPFLISIMPTAFPLTAHRK